MVAPAATAGIWMMPSLIGKDLQGTQDAIQSPTHGDVWFSGSTDLTGLRRMQFDDRNWVVCTSAPLPGAAFDESTAIDFGVVRIGTDACP